MSHTFCAECGGKVTEGAAFCGMCGHAAAAPEAEDGTSTVFGTAGAAPAAPQWPVPPPEPDPTATMVAARASQPTPPYGASVYPPPPAGPPAYGGPQPPTGPPAYGAAPAKKGSTNLILLGVVSAALVIAGFFGVTYLMDQKDDTAEPSAAAATTASPSAPAASSASASDSASGPAADPASDSAAAEQPGGTVEPTPFTPPPPLPVAPGEAPPAPVENARPVDERYQLYRRGSGFAGSYSRAGALTDRTSGPFMYAVAEAYASSGAGGDSVVLTNVYSSVTQKTYRMTCNAQSDATVICSGGVGAKVLLFN